MEMPATVLCEKCGARSDVVAANIDQPAMAGKMAAGDKRWDEGFFFTIDCPNCGARMQCLAPPP